jgi:hypothetical protein
MIMNDIFEKTPTALKVMYTAFVLIAAAYFAGYVFGKFFSS